MKIGLHFVPAFASFLGTLAAMAFGQTKQPVDFVDPHIGSISYLLKSEPPTVQLPFGMMRLAPLTSPGISDYYLAEKVYGFPVDSVILMPTTGPIETDPGKNASRYDHDFETASPYYYAVTLEKSNTRVEYTVAERAAYFRITYPDVAPVPQRAGPASADLKVGATRDADVAPGFSPARAPTDRGATPEKEGVQRYLVFWVRGEGSLSADPAHSVISGYEDVRGTRHYFYAESSRRFTLKGVPAEGKASVAPPFRAACRAEARRYNKLDPIVSEGPATETGRNIAVGVRFPAAEGNPFEWRIGISYISVDQARRNVEEGIPSWGFAAVKSRARDVWNQALGKIAVRGGSEDQKTIFYTALYRSLCGMADITEDGQYYSGYDKQVHSSGGHDFYVDDSLWDTYRSLHPLQLLLDPRRQLDMVRSYIRMYEQSGWMPRDPTVGGPGIWMIGNHSAAFIADTYAKGYTDFDAEKAYEGIRKNATQATVLPWRLGPLTPLDRVYQEQGFFPALARGETEASPDVFPSERRQAVSVTLENSYDDWCVAQVAKALHKEEDYAYFLKRARNYQNVFNPAIGFMAPRSSDGKWVEDFDPKLGGGQGGRDYFTECNGWVYTFHVQHDVAGLIELMGGRNNFVERLEGLFEEPFGVAKFRFLSQFPDATALFGNHTQGDEPGFHIPYLYNYAGAPWMTQRRVREIMKIWYTSGLMGIPGDEDWGAMSSWYVFSAMGFYPVCPGSPTYNIGSPIFDEAKISLENGRVFILRALNQSAHNKYIQSATLNGKPLSKPWFSHSDIAQGGTLILQMGPQPKKSWGSALEATPPSMSESQ
jgi:predicted alpha-1,2-mannosidase